MRKKIHDFLQKHFVRKFERSRLKLDKAHDQLDFFEMVINEHKSFKIPFIKKIKMYYNGFSNDEYVIYDLKKNDMKDYINEAVRWKSRKINGNYNIIFDDKRLFYEVFKSYFNIPRTLGKIENGKIIFNNKEVPIESFNKKVKQYNGVIICPIALGGGKYIHYFSVVKGKLNIDYHEISLKDLKKFINEQKEMIITPYLVQHEYSKKIFDKSVNTIRLIIIKNDNNRHEIILAVHRFGCNSSIPVDNISNGGIYAKIDIETGILSEAKSYYDLNTYRTHPDTKAQIKGVKVPNWKAIKKDILSVLESFTYIKFLALDVVVTKTGYSVIEGNASSGLKLLQHWNGQKKNTLGEFFRKEGVMK